MEETSTERYERLKPQWLEAHENFHKNPTVENALEAVLVSIEMEGIPGVNEHWDKLLRTTIDGLMTRTKKAQDENEKSVDANADTAAMIFYNRFQEKAYPAIEAWKAARGGKGAIMEKRETHE
jgi:hypothetical protein